MFWRICKEALIITSKTQIIHKQNTKEIIAMKESIYVIKHT